MLDIDQKNFLKELIQNIYSYELLFQDMKMNELNINWSDEKFIIPSYNQLKGHYELLKTFGDKVYNRLSHMIQKEAINTLENNINSIDKVINYSYKIIAA